MPQEFFGDGLDDLVARREKEEEVKIGAQRVREAKEREVRKKQEVYEQQIEGEIAIIKARSNVTCENCLDAALTALVGLADFNRIRREFLSISGVVYRIKYIDRVVYEQLPEHAGLFMCPQKTVDFHDTLKDVGLSMLCPYFNRKNANSLTHEDCMIDGEAIPALCSGLHDGCVVFKDRIMRASQGLIELQFPKPTMVLPYNQQCLVDLKDLDDWWLGEGKYE